MIDWASIYAYSPVVAWELESQAVLCENKLLSRCKVHGKGKGHCKYWEGKNEMCFYYYADLEHCGNAKAQCEALKNNS